MNRRKSLILIAMVVLLLTFTVSGTIAWLAASTDSVENVFTPGKVGTDIVEDFDGTTKSSIRVENKESEGSTVPVYVRVAISGYWINEAGEIVRPWQNAVTLNEATEPSNSTYEVPANGVWFYCATDGFYYFNRPLAPGELTTDLLGADLTYLKENGETLVINVVHQSIQAEPTSTVATVWGVTVAGDGTISKS